MARAALIVICLIAVFFATWLFAIEIGEYSDSAAPIESETGRIIIITLRSNRTTGYEWQLAEPLNTKVVDFMSSEYMTNPPQMTGSPGTEAWLFRAMGEGKTKIDFKYVRLWEKDVEPGQKISFDIVVTAPKTEEADAEAAY